MKKLYFLLYSFVSVLGFSQTILNQSESTTRTVQDPTVVVLAPGFHATSSVSNPFIAKIGEATENTGGGPNTPSNAGSENPSGTTETETNRFHDTQGNIDVNGGGQLQFTLPIALPPGVKSVAPQINLVYTSGSGNGIAGYGWALSGLTAISRTSKTIEKDNELKGIQLDYSDIYSLNGQRLILKSGEYGKDNAEYLTEKFSNVKIKSKGAVSVGYYQGPEFWEVTFEDGSQAWYGAVTNGSSSARNPIEYNIVKWKDSHGNYITYSYLQDNNVVRIDQISWGGNETIGKSHFNTIHFSYATRKLKETSFAAGQKFVQSYILENVEVLTNGVQFKRYNIANEENPNNKYEFVKAITEKSSKDVITNTEETSNSVLFTYDDPAIESWKESRIKDSNQDQKGISGDFDGDGLMDLIKSDGTTLYLYKDVFGNKTKVNIGNLPYLSTNLLNSTSFTIKNDQNQILSRQGFIVLQTLTNNGVGTHDKKDLIVRGYSIDDSNQIILEFEKTVLGEKYDYTYYSGDVFPPDFPIPPNGYSEIKTTVVSSVLESRDFDLDGDGLSELILKVHDSFHDEIITYYSDRMPDIVYNSHTALRNVIVQPYANDINQNVNSFTTPQDFFKDTIYGDFDGDGKLDFMAGKDYIASFTKTNGAFNTSYKNISRLEGLFEGAVAGDFNGDGKTDLLIPQADKSSDWNLYLSDGKNFVKEVKNNLSYYSKQFEVSDQDRHRNFIFETYCNYGTYTGYHYAADDLDGDGRSELVVTKVKYRDHSWNSHFDSEYTEVNSSIFTTTKSSDLLTVFTQQGVTKNFLYNKVIVPFSSTSMYRNGKKLILLGKPVDCANSDCESFIFLEANNFKDITKYSRIKTINQGGVLTTVQYSELNTDVNPTLYKEVKKEQFPYLELKKVPQSYVVSQLSQNISVNGINKIRKQDFLYRGLVGHLQGKGIVGFRQTARSSYYTEDLIATKTWSGSEIDPLNDGVVIKEWSIKTSTDSQVFPLNISKSNEDLLSFKSTQYKFDKLLNGVLITGAVSPANKPKVVSATVPIKLFSKDFMNDIVEESNIKYDDYYLPYNTITAININFATKTTNLTFDHKLNGIGKDYYVGRLIMKEELIQVDEDTKGSKEEYTYDNNLLKTLKTFNRDNSGGFVEGYKYDGWGNVEEKTTSKFNTSGSSSNSDLIVNKVEYDSKGRFVVKKTDNLGLETLITYNDWGLIETQTDPLGNVSTNTYDRWGKLRTSNNKLGGTTTYTYEKTSVKDAVTTVHSPDGNKTISYTNNLGQNYKSTIKKFSQGQYISVVTEYDALGRKTRESEPFSGQAASQWNLTKYDEYSRPIRATSYTKKIVENTYLNKERIVITIEKDTQNGVSNRFKKQTTDPLGNIISSEDLGGIINFKFNAAGENTEANYEGNSVKTSYDAWGNKIRFDDPSNGVYEYEYNGFMGAISRSVSPKGEKTFEYNNLGQLKKQTEKTKTGNATDKVINFSYDSKGMIIQKYGISLGKSYGSGITYDSFGRVLSSYEDSNGKYFMKKGITYDDKMRITSYEKSLYSSGILTKVSIENVYSSWNGELYQLKEKNTGKILWELNEVNDKGQVKNVKLGSVNIINTYNDDNGFLMDIKHISLSANTVLDVRYNFDAIKNELKDRITMGDMSLLETFQYDDNNRLYNWTDPVSGTYVKDQKRNVYDKRGRITSNDHVGAIKFNDPISLYRSSGMTLNAEGASNYNNDLLQQITYNENNDPIFIDGVKGDVAFEYGLTSMRQRVTYGGNFEEGADGKFTKYYSGDGSYEIVKNNQTGQEKHLIYIGGSPYESNIVFLKEFATNTAKFVFLHKDYLGSVLAITDEAGSKLEQRHFDAWGNLTHLKIGNNGTITNKEQIRDYLSNGNLVVDRGYTGHEHFAEVGLIHMNGRLYDPLLRRFLNADENIQDPHNTQNYNKYGYVMNNPLMYNDPNGEFAFLAFLAIPLVKAILIGAAVGLASYTLGMAITGNLDRWNIGGALKATFFGAVGGAATFGVGSIFSAVGPSGEAIATALAKAITKSVGDVGLAVIQAGTHAISQGVLGLMQGANFLTSAVSGFAGSIGASGWSSFMGTGGGAMIAFGALAGGIGAELTGGNFWQGAVIGGVVAGLNHGLHAIDDGDPPGNKKAKTVDNTKEAVEHYFNGEGEDIEVGWKSKNKLLGSSESRRVSQRLVNGEANNLSGNFAANLTNDYQTFHIGRTRVDYSTSCTVGTCTTKFTAFSGDGFRDPLDIGQTLGKVPFLKNINVEILTGKSYNYRPWNYSIQYKNPGYPVGNNLR